MAPDCETRPKVVGSIHRKGIHRQSTYQVRGGEQMLAVKKVNKQTILQPGCTLAWVHKNNIDNS